MINQKHYDTAMLQMKANEHMHLYPDNFLEKGVWCEINDKYRRYSIDWLVELHFKLKCGENTLYLAVSIIDKMLIKWKNFEKDKLQILIIAAFNAALKHCKEEGPTVNQILHVINSKQLASQVEIMEFKIENSIKIDPNQPSILRFMEKIANFAGFKEEKLMIAKMLCDFTLIDSTLLKVKPSLLAAVSIYATNVLMNKQRPWNAGLMKYSGGLCSTDLEPLVDQLFESIKVQQQSHYTNSLFQKYSQDKYLGVVSKLDARLQVTDPWSTEAAPPVDL